MWLWVTMLLKATHEPLERDFCGKTVTLQPGQFISGRQALAAETGLTEMKVRISIDRLKNDQQIIQQTGNKGSMFTVLNWDKYQINNQQNNQPTTSQQPANNQPTTTNKNIRMEECKNDYSKQERVTDIVDFQSTPTPSRPVKPVSPKKTKLEYNPSPEFKAFWNEVPSIGKSRSSPVKAWTEWSKLKSESQVDLDKQILDVMASLNCWKACDKWTAPGRESGRVGEYIEGIHIWIRDRNWEEFPPSSTGRTVVKQEFQIDESSYI